jgi:SAM-dependent methyltransferase
MQQLAPERPDLKSRLLARTSVYRLWQAPFAEKKLRPLFRYNDVAGFKRVLDVGCGPGTNTPHFLHTDYVGVDINPEYIAFATQRFQKSFLVADITEFTPPTGARFDCILLNSFLHHIDDAGVERILSQLPPLLTPDGHVHILDLVLPSKPCVARFLAHHDRGEFPRPLERWRELFSRHFEPVVFEPYPLKTFFGLSPTLWNMLYFKGKARST